MKIGDTVVVVKSPYNGVKVGTVAVIEEVKEHHFGTRNNLYVLKGLKSRNFREQEIKLVKEETDENIYSSS
jgi:hypothetical protein